MCEQTWRLGLLSRSPGPSCSRSCLPTEERFSTPSWGFRKSTYSRDRTLKAANGDCRARTSANKAVPSEKTARGVGGGLGSGPPSQAWNPSGNTDLIPHDPSASLLNANERGRLLQITLSVCHAEGSPWNAEDILEASAGLILAAPVPSPYTRFM